VREKKIPDRNRDMERKEDAKGEGVNFDQQRKNKAPLETGGKIKPLPVESKMLGRKETWEEA